MVATNDEFPLKKQTSPSGVSGIEISGGVYNEDYLQKLQGTAWAKEADKMRTQDAQIKMILNSVRNPILGATWEWMAADTSDKQSVQHRDFVEFVLTCDMMRPWNTFINEVLSFIPFGHSVFEIIHKNVSNHSRFGSYTGIKALSWRSAKTLEEWQLDRTTGELKGILQRSSGDFTNDVIIPSEFLLVFSLDLEGNYFSSTSRSWLRPVYGNYLMKQFLRKLKGIGHEKMTVGTPAGTIPSDASEEDERKFEQMLQRYTTNENQYLKLPEGFLVNILRGEFNSEGLEIGIDAENKEMVRGFLANFLNLGQGTVGSGGGSFALGADLSDFFLKGIVYVSELICDVMNRRLIPHIIDINFGEQEAYPKLICSGVQDVGKEMSEIIEKYVTSGALVVDETLRKFLRKLHKLPPEDEVHESSITKEPDPAVGSTDSSQVAVRSIAEPSSEEPNPTSNETDKSTDTQITAQPIPAIELQMSGRTIISQASEGLEEVMALNLDFIANKLQADIVNRFNNLPAGRKRKATDRILAGGVSKYTRDLRATLTDLAAIAINEAESEADIKVTKFSDPLNIAVDIASGVAKADFPKLPLSSRDKINQMATDIATAHAADLEKAAIFAANNSIESTGDAGILAQDIKEATNKKSKQLIAATPVSTASELVNSVRLDTFLRKESKDAGIVGFQFFNPDPVSPICQNLAGRIFSVDNKDAARFFPPLHFNCKSTLIPIKAESPKAARIDDSLGLEIVSDSPDDFNRIKNSVQFSDSQILKMLADVRLTLTFQTLLFDRKVFSRGQASQWAANRGFSTVDTEELEDFIAIRQRHPDEFKSGTITRIDITQGVHAMAGDLVTEMPEEDPMRAFSMDIISLKFKDDVIPRSKAMEFIRENGMIDKKINWVDKTLEVCVSDESQFDSSSILTDKLKSGITATYGKMKSGFTKDDKQNALQSSLKLFLLSQIDPLQSLQALIFDKGNFSKERAVRFAKDHRFKYDKVDESGNSFSLRQHDPDEFVSGSFQTIDITSGLKAVVGRIKNVK